MHILDFLFFLGILKIITIDILDDHISFHSNFIYVYSVISVV